MSYWTIRMKRGHENLPIERQERAICKDGEDVAEIRREWIPTKEDCEHSVLGFVWETGKSMEHYSNPFIRMDDCLQDFIRYSKRMEGKKC